MTRGIIPPQEASSGLCCASIPPSPRACTRAGSACPDFRFSPSARPWLSSGFAVPDPYRTGSLRQPGAGVAIGARFRLLGHCSSHWRRTVACGARLQRQEPSASTSSKSVAAELPPASDGRGLMRSTCMNSLRPPFARAAKASAARWLAAASFAAAACVLSADVSLRPHCSGAS